MPDFRWIPQNGLMIGPDGDLADTSSRQQEELLEMIRTRIEASEEGWQLYPEIGAGLSSLVGRAAGEEVLLLAERLVYRSLSGQFLPPQALTVRAEPSGDGIMVQISVSGTVLGEAVLQPGSAEFRPWRQTA